MLSARPDVLPRERRQLAQALVHKPFKTGALVEAVRAARAGVRRGDPEATID